MSDSQPQPARSLDEQRAEYARRRGLAMPLAGLIAWTLIGIAGASLPPTLAVWLALLVYAIAIPFFRVDYTSLPLTVGILSGLMWIPFSWIIQHWVGIFHTVTRTVLVTAAWYLAPHGRFVVIPAVIVGVYAVTIVILEQRWRAVGRGFAAAATAGVPGRHQ
jgi:hypothetical protein